MKKLLPFLVLLHFSGIFSQTKLVSHPLQLTKSTDYHQILNAVNSENQVFVFASDKENFHLLKFNSALFFADSLHLKRPDKSSEKMIGHSFDENGNPYVYWATNDFKKIIATRYDLTARNSVTFNHDLILKKESIVLTFTENNIFYILTQGETEDFLKLYAFNNGKMLEKQMDFSAYHFINSRNKPITFHEILSDYPIEKMDSKKFNPLFYSIYKSKLYIKDNLLYLTLDHNPFQTQIFSVDLSTSTVSEKTILQPVLHNNKGESNSYLFDTNLYQLRLNDEQLAFEIKQFPSGQLVNSFNVSQKDSISFKNSPLYIQNGNEKPRELKTTQKFLRRLSSSTVGLSVYETQGKNLITIGRAKNVASTGDLLLGAALTVGIAVGGGGVFVNDFFEDSVQSIYFESLFDKNMHPVTGKPEPLAIDYISEFLGSHGEIRNDSVFPYNNFFILGYYDIVAGQYVLRKFQDGFD